MNQKSAQPDCGHFYSAAIRGKMWQVLVTIFWPKPVDIGCILLFLGLQGEF